MTGLSNKLEEVRRNVRNNVRGALEDKFREWCAAADIRLVSSEDLRADEFVDESAEGTVNESAHERKEKDGEENGTLRPWDIVVHDKRLFGRILSHGTLGLGEAYMDGWWDCEQMDVMFCKAIRAGIERRIEGNFSGWLHETAFRFLNLQTRSRAFMAAKHHYNADPALFRAMLDPYMQYSCGYWGQADNLEDAQLAKMEMICRKLKLEPGMSVLDIGCGWGGLARYMAEHYQVRVTGITVSDGQLAVARENAGELPVEYLLLDYRDLPGSAKFGEKDGSGGRRWDRVVSVGMFEHVGRRNYDVFLKVARRCLKPDGLFLLHCIGSNGRGCGADPWLTRYIFPNGVLPSTSVLTKALEGIFVMEDWHNFGADYSKTLLAWQARFHKGCEEGAFACEERLHRMFDYYLSSCAGAFRARCIQLWQLVLSPEGVPGGYDCRRD